MRERLQRHLESTGLIPPGALVLVAYSGGADSTCLLTLLHGLGYAVTVAHLHHGERAEADDEANRCTEYCTRLGVTLLTGRADVPRMSQELGMSREAAGRHARQAFLEQAARETKCALIATGHTRDDHVETVLFHVARGTGLAGLAGIPVRRGPYVRPLLGITREETRAYCRDRELWFHDDPSNHDLNLSRARIRHRVLPELRHAHPGTDESIVRLAELAHEEDNFLDGAAAAALEQYELPLNGELSFLTQDCEIAFGRAAIGHLPRVLFRRAMRLAVGALGSTLTFHQCEVLTDQFATEPTGSVTSEGGVVVVSWDESVLRVGQTLPTMPFRYGLTVPGETLSDEFGWVLTAVPTTSTGEGVTRSALNTVIDGGRVKGQLYFRSVEPGDRIAPLGMEGTRKLADLLSEAGLTPAARRRLPIVCDFMGPVWAPGVTVSHRVRCDATTERALGLRFGPTPGATLA